MSFLDTPVNIIVSDLLIVMAIFITLSQMPHLYFWLERKKWNPEGIIFTQARKDGLPVREMCAMSGFTWWELGTKEVKGDPAFEVDRNTRQGVHLDPRLASGGSPREFAKGGMEIMHYSTSSSIAMSSKTAMAFKTIVEHVRKNYPGLAFLPESLIVEYVQLIRANLPHDCNNIVETYDFEGKIDVPKSVLDEFRNLVVEQLKTKLFEDGETREPTKEEIDEAYNRNVALYKRQHYAQTLSKTFQKIQDEVVKLPIETDRYFSFTEAFQNSPLATFPADLQNYLQTIELMATMKKSLDAKAATLLIYIIGIVAILVGGALAINMLPAGR